MSVRIFFFFSFFFEGGVKDSTVFGRKVIWGPVTQTLAQRIAQESAEKVLLSPVPTFATTKKNIHPISLEFSNLPRSIYKFHAS